ncbi:YIP1 family protein [Paraneptunicella aestuarii]|uniref:Yip1 family protein n=1 Tax=Paraneptunicella aestuarii TaxID=2831148 RepID=UPI001E63C512|nr:Yip1 family protein [Paraneptunicella aestuarii]UAA37856.1 YIP1 family protein [Paraneptunicella aestuarii]
MHPISNPFQACKQIILKPNSVFATLREKQNWSWIPFFLIVAANMLPGLLYFQTIDFDWYMELLTSSQYGQVSPAEQETFKNSMSREQMRYLTMLGSTAGLAIANAIFAVYINLFTKSDEENTRNFSDWYGFGWWVSLPSVIAGFIATVIILLFGSEQMLPTIINPTSLAFLFNMPLDSPLLMFGQVVRLENFWTMYLIAVGLSQWTNLPSRKTYLIAVVPYFIIWFALLLAA